MAEEKKLTLEEIDELLDKEESSFNFRELYTMLILNWQWFAISLVACLIVAVLYLRYATPVYEVSSKMLIKDEDNRGRNNSILNMTNLGMMSNSEGIDNEMEILSSHIIATDVVRDLKLYTSYILKGRVKNTILYKNQPVTVDIDAPHLERLSQPIHLTIERDKSNYKVKGSYFVSTDDNRVAGPYSIDKVFTSLPQTLKTKAGDISFVANGNSTLSDGSKMMVTIQSPYNAAYKYQSAFHVNPTSKSTTIVRMILVDEIPRRAMDYLNQIVICYNRQANEDKNEVAKRTEEFINARLEKINAELGETESQLESYKRSQHMTELPMNATQAMSGAGEYDQRLAEANTQMQLLNSIGDYMDRPENKYQTLPSNVGLSDATASSLKSCSGVMNRISRWSSKKPWSV